MNYVSPMETIILYLFLLYELSLESANMPRRKVNVKQQISLAFLENEELTWKELLEKTGVSKGSLSKYLNKMIDMGLVETDVDRTTRPASIIYRDWTHKSLKDLNWHSVSMQERLQDFKEKLQKLKTLDKVERQKEFDKIFVYILLNLLIDHLVSFGAGLTIQAYAKTKELSEEAYFWFLRESSFTHTAKAIFELLAGDPENVRLFYAAIANVILIAEKIRPEGGKPSDINQFIKQVITHTQLQDRRKKV